jgi:hypothetical protein
VAAAERREKVSCGHNCESSSRRRSAGTVSSWRTSRRLQRRTPRVVWRASISRRQAKSIVCPVMCERSGRKMEFIT